MSDRMAWHDGGIAVANTDVNTRAAFITRTYLHVFGAIAAFTMLEVAIFNSGIMESIAMKLVGGGTMGWVLVLAAFMGIGWFATRTAHSAKSVGMQYFALSLYVVAHAIIFCPMLYFAASFYPDAIALAAVITLVGFAALTGIAFYTRKDFSFLRGALMWGGVGAMIMIGAGLLMGFNLGVWFSVGMVVLMGIAILYDTSNVLHHYPSDKHVAASLQLFASIAMMFFYVLRIVIALQND